MKVGVMQPYLFPYIGYFQLIREVDKFIIYDDVNYIKNGWINRNQYLERDKAKLFTLPIDGGSSYKKIKDTIIKDNNSLMMKNKILKTIKTNYSKAPFYSEIIELLEEIILNPETHISLYNEYSIRRICDFLRINTEILVSSNINKAEQLKGEERLISMCKSVNASVYINAIGGKTLYNTSNFIEHGLELQYIRTNDKIRYKQFNDEYIPNLSIIDVLMFNGSQGTLKLLDEYILED